jgi:8-oxo-dGTP pyrophosphatase MutT (NUDIX family)
VIVISGAQIADTPLAWPVDSSTVLAEGGVGRFVQDHVRTPDGEVMTREYVRHPGAVGVIALDDHERVALVRQYRHPVRHRLVEPPAGLLDVEGEDYLVAAQRELAEEVGLAATTWHVLVDLFTTPGMIGETLRIYLARGLSAADAPDGYLKAGEEAHMDIVWATLDDLVAAVLDGRVHNPTLVSGALAAWAARERDSYAGLRPADADWPAREALADVAPLA